MQKMAQPMRKRALPVLAIACLALGFPLRPAAHERGDRLAGESRSHSLMATDGHCRAELRSLFRSLPRSCL